MKGSGVVDMSDRILSTGAYLHTVPIVAQMPTQNVLLTAIAVVQVLFEPTPILRL